MRNIAVQVIIEFCCEFNDISAILYSGIIIFVSVQPRLKNYKSLQFPARSSYYWLSIKFSCRSLNGSPSGRICRITFKTFSLIAICVQSRQAEFEVHGQRLNEVEGRFKLLLRLEFWNEIDSITQVLVMFVPKEPKKFQTKY